MDLAGATIAGEAMTEQQLQGYLFLILAAGHETTQNAISGGAYALMQHPKQRELLERNPELLDGAVEEILRWTCPIVHMSRTAARDVELRGRTIRAGDLVALFYPSANRDEDVFGDPLRFDVGRAPNRHRSFGVG